MPDAGSPEHQTVVVVVRLGKADLVVRLVAVRSLRGPSMLGFGIVVDALLVILIVVTLVRIFPIFHILVLVVVVFLVILIVNDISLVPLLVVLLIELLLCFFAIFPDGFFFLELFIDGKLGLHRKMIMGRAHVLPQVTC